MTRFERLMDLNIRNVHFRHGDGTLGWPEQAPFDRILIAAGAPEIPRKLLLSQLIDGGVAVLPYGPQDQQMLVVDQARRTETDRNGNLPLPVCETDRRRRVGRQRKRPSSMRQSMKLSS